MKDALKEANKGNIEISKKSLNKAKENYRYIFKYLLNAQTKILSTIKINGIEKAVGNLANVNKGRKDRLNAISIMADSAAKDVNKK
ncbi:MAG: hypothetical protein E7214_02440 [Clostridium sp.]|nr:hypothetical protein [Clostridium sp.]